jgi:hypothetical protein
MSIPELAEQMGHSPQMTVMTYTHVIRELKGEPAYLCRKADQTSSAKACGPEVDPKRGTGSAKRTRSGGKNACTPAE